MVDGCWLLEICEKILSPACHCEARSNQKESETGRIITKENNIEYLYELKPYMNLNALYGEKRSICQSEFISDSFLIFFNRKVRKGLRKVRKVKNLWPETKGRTDKVICGENNRSIYKSEFISAGQNGILWKSKKSKNLRSLTI